MLGMIFTELLESIEKEYGYGVVDQLLSNDKLASKGIYTAVGRYQYTDLLVLITQLSEIVQIPTKQLVSDFGLQIFKKLMDSHPQLVKDIDDSFDLLSKIDSHIHVEVFKLYPSAQLPRFSFTRIDNDHIQLHYQSTRPFAPFAEGLMHGCTRYFNEKFIIKCTPQADNNESDVVFGIIRKPLEGSHQSVNMKRNGRNHG